MIAAEKRSTANTAPNAAARPTGDPRLALLVRGSARPGAFCSKSAAGYPARVSKKVLLDHIVLNVHDIETMLMFYVDLVGLAPERIEEFRCGEALFPSVRINEDTLIDLMPPAMWEHGDAAGPGRNLDHFCLNLPRHEWQAAIARLETAGHAVEAGPMTLWGAHGDAIAVYLRDPENNRVELRYYE